jgi:hypothetical protein
MPDIMRISSPRFIGREDELGQLQASFDGSRQGQPAIVLVGAEAGVGKTRLLHEYVNRCRASGATVMLGGCIELGTGRCPSRLSRKRSATLRTTSEMNVSVRC